MFEVEIYGRVRRAVRVEGKTRGVHGIREIVLDEKQKTMRMKLDFTRLNRSVVMELLRSAGIDIVEEVSLAVPPVPRSRARRPCRRSKLAPRQSAVTR
jgi:hypothetical protein